MKRLRKLVELQLFRGRHALRAAGSKEPFYGGLIHGLQEYGEQGYGRAAVTGRKCGFPPFILDRET